MVWPGEERYQARQATWFLTPARDPRVQHRTRPNGHFGQQPAENQHLGRMRRSGNPTEELLHGSPGRNDLSEREAANEELTLSSGSVEPFGPNDWCLADAIHRSWVLEAFAGPARLGQQFRARVLPQTHAHSWTSGPLPESWFTRHREDWEVATQRRPSH